jgi:hypothetical protein
MTRREEAAATAGRLLQEQPFDYLLYDGKTTQRHQGGFGDFHRAADKHFFYAGAPEQLRKNALALHCSDIEKHTDIKDVHIVFHNLPTLLEGIADPAKPIDIAGLKNNFSVVSSLKLLTEEKMEGFKKMTRTDAVKRFTDAINQSNYERDPDSAEAAAWNPDILKSEMMEEYHRHQAFAQGLTRIEAALWDVMSTLMITPPTLKSAAASR